MAVSGDITESTVRALGRSSSAGDVLVDGGNSHWRDSQRRAAELQSRGVALVDCGTSGGIWGLANGYCLMVGGDAQAVSVVEPAFRTLAPKDGYAHVGPSGAGHFTKMVHNAIEYGLLGTTFTTSSACASSGHAIGMALLAIRSGEADLIVTGGSEAATTRLAISGFASAKALSTRNENPELASRPFDKDRDGFVMGEGAGILIFEELERARKRGAKIYAEVKGYGSTDDAFHITAPKEDGGGPARAFHLALKMAGIDPETVDYVNAHGTSTPYNDVIETRALKRCFGDHARRLAISSTKSMIGHLLGASSGVELVATALSVHERRVHPTRNLENPDPECDLDYVPGDARELVIQNALSNSLGFGGHNVSICIGRLD